jgi:hypothetical protein
MPIKNYTTKIDAGVSLGKIQSALASAGASKIIVDYEDGVPIAVSFGMLLGDTMCAYKLPVNFDGVEAVLKKQKIKADKKQIMRIAWRNVRDWVLAQIALIEAGNAVAGEIFLPYMTDKTGTTFYQQLMSTGQLTLPSNIQNTEKA